MPLIDLINYVASLSPAQRDAIRTISIAVGTGSVPLFGLILTWMWRIIRRGLNEIKGQTSTQDYVNGKLVPSSLGEMVRRTMHNTEELKSADLATLINDPRTTPVTRATGRRRLPTTEMPQTHYLPPIGETDHE